MGLTKMIFGPAQFWFGLSIGLVVAFMICSLVVLRVPVGPSDRSMKGSIRFFHQGSQIDHDHAHEMMDNEVNKIPAARISFEDTHLHHDDDSVAKELYEKVRVLCWIMTAPQNLDQKARAVKETWGKRCNVLIFFSSVTNTSFPTVGLNTSEGREHLTAKTVQAFRYVYEKHFNDADWFIKADDDTYMIVENLRYFLSDEDTNAAVYFGHHFKVIVKQGYYSGGGGYVLSREALRRFYEKGKDPHTCRQDGGAEDAEFGLCMQNLGVQTRNSTDVMGRSRFHCFDPETHLLGGYPNWYHQYDANGARKGVDSISDYAISFHYVSPNHMYGLELYIYHLRPYGITSGLQNLNRAHDTPKPI